MLLLVRLDRVGWTFVVIDKLITRPNVLFKEITCVLNLQKKKLCKLQHGKNGWHMSVQLLVLFAMMMNRVSTISKKLSKHTKHKLKYYFHIKSQLYMKFPHTKISFQNGTGIQHQKSVYGVPILPIKISRKICQSY